MVDLQALYEFIGQTSSAARRSPPPPVVRSAPASPSSASNTTVQDRLMRLPEVLRVGSDTGDD